MTAVERDNPALKDVLPKEYGRDALDKERLGQVVDLVSNIRVGGADAQANDVLGQVYEYFLETVRPRGRAQGRRVLHPALRGAAVGGDAGTVPGTGL